MKKTSTAYILWALTFIGFAGINRFYVGKIGTGILYFLTLGFCGIGTIYDLFVIPQHVKMANLIATAGQQQQVVVNVVNNVNNSNNGQ